MLTLYILLVLLTAIYIYTRPGFSFYDKNRLTVLILGAIFWPAYWLGVLYVAFVKAKTI